MKPGMQINRGFSMRNTSIMFVSLCLFLTVSGAALAHVPYIEGRDFKEGDVFAVKAPLEKSIALMAYFHDEDDVDVATFTLTPEDFTETEDGVYGKHIFFGTMVPACSLYDEVLPSAALVGPRQGSLPLPDEDDIFPFQMGADEGLTVVENDEQGEEYYEEYTMKTYFVRTRKKFFSPNRAPTSSITGSPVAPSQTM